MNPQEIERELNAFAIPIGVDPHNKARERASDQVSVDQAKKKYLSTLAWFVIYYYLKLLGFDVKSEESYCWHPIFNFNPKLNITDIFISELGRLEVFYVLPDEQHVSLPFKLIDNREAYVYVQLNKTLTSGTILGYTFPKKGIVPLDKLSSFIELLSNGKESLKVASVSRSSSTKTVEKETISEVKYIDLASHAEKIELRITKKLESSKNHISVIVKSVENQLLPPDIELALVDKQSKTIIQKISDGTENNLTFNFSRTSGIPFLIKIKINDSEVIEQFSN